MFKDIKPSENHLRSKNARFQRTTLRICGVLVWGYSVLPYHSAPLVLPCEDKEPKSCCDGRGLTPFLVQRIKQRPRDMITESDFTEATQLEKANNTVLTTLRLPKPRLNTHKMKIHPQVDL